jgi:hypothetical protein
MLGYILELGIIVFIVSLGMMTLKDGKGLGELNLNNNLARIVAPGLTKFHF